MIKVVMILISFLRPAPVEFSMPVDTFKKFDHAPVGKFFPKFDYKSWTFLGPQPVANEPWSGSNVSGRVTSIAIDPTNNLVVYVTGAQGGVWKTTDGGTTWSPMTDGLSSLASGYIAIDPNNNLTLYYGTGELHYCGDCFYGDGLFKSTDGGTTWTKIATTTQVGTRIAKIVVNPLNSNNIFVAGNYGLIVSADGGTTWSTVLSGYCDDVEIDPVNSNNVYASLWGQGIYKSTDGGSTWTQLSGGLPTTGFTRIEIAIAPTNPLVLYASFASTSYTLLGLYKSTDGGATWTQLTNTPDYLNPQGFYDHCIIVDPTNENVVYAGGVYPYPGSSYYGLVMTTDGGATWTDITLASDGTKLHPDMQTLAISSNGELWVGTDGGVWKTTSPGTTWTNLNSTLGITQFYTIGLHPTRSDSMLGGTQDNGTPVYSGSLTWNEVSSGDGGPCLFDWYDPGYYFTTYVKLQNIYEYYNGAYQADIAGPWVSLGDRASWANGPFVMDPVNHNIMYVGTYRVWKTSDYGSTWTAISGDLTAGSGVLLSLAVAPSNTSVIYTGSSDGYVYKTTDGGTTWTQIDGGLFGSSQVTDIVVNPTNSLEIYLSLDASSGSRVYMTSDGGTTWNDLTGTLPAGLRGLSLAVDFLPTVPQIYLGTDYGVYFTSDNGATWSLVGPGLPNLAIYELKIDTANNYVVAASHGRGVWRTQVISTLTEEDFSRVSFDINYSISHGQISLTGLDPRILYRVKVFDPSGRLVKYEEIVGYKSFSIRVHAGIYFIKVDFSNYEKFFKVLVLK